MLKDYLSQLLTRQNNSELARHLHYGLCGLRASLESALQRASQDDDPEVVEMCNKLINEIKQLLQQPTPSKNEQSQEDNNSDLPSSEFKLKDLREAFLNDKTLEPYLGDFKLSTENSKLWDEIHRLLLRISEKRAKEWRDRTYSLAQKVNAEINKSAVIKLPYKEDTPLYDGLILTENIQAKGLYLSTKTPLDKRLDNDALDGDLKFLAQVVSICLHFIEKDRFLHHCLKGVHDFGIIPLDSEERKSSYTKALIDRFQCVQKSEDNPVESLRYRLDLDEAIHSLVYLPLVETGSWWSKLQDEARKTLQPAVEKANKAGDSAMFQLLAGPYENVTRYTQPAPRGNLAVENCRTPGKVLVCLRVYAKINGEDILGRVLYCPIK
jgi:hypothetical protein